MRPLLISLAAILLLALGLRLGFAWLVVAQHDSASFADIHGDIAGYVRIGERMYDRRGYTAEGAVHRNRGLIRPPGYPAFYTATRAVYGVIGVDLQQDLRPIVWPQVMLSLLGVAATYALGYVVLKSVAAATIAGLLAALSPTGIACASIAMPDALFAGTFAAGFVVWLNVICRPSVGSSCGRWCIFGGVMFAAAALLKPAAIYFPLVAVPLLVLRLGRTRHTWDAGRQLFLPMLICVGTWSAYNWTFEGVPAYSIVSQRNLRYGVVPKVELTAKLGRLPTQAEYFRYARQFTDRDEAFIRADNASPAALYLQIGSETRSALRQHPVQTLRVLGSNLTSQATSRYKRIHQQLPDASMGPSNVIRRIYDWTDTPTALVLWYAPLLAALPLWWRDRSRRIGLALCWIGLLYIVVPTATVADEGSRLILAAEPMAVVLIVASVWRVLTWAISGVRSRQASFVPHISSRS